MQTQNPWYLPHHRHCSYIIFVIGVDGVVLHEAFISTFISLLSYKKQPVSSSLPWSTDAGLSRFFCWQFHNNHVHRMCFLSLNARSACQHIDMYHNVPHRQWKKEACSVMRFNISGLACVPFSIIDCTACARKWNTPPSWAHTVSQLSSGWIMHCGSTLLLL